MDDDTELEFLGSSENKQLYLESFANDTNRDPDCNPIGLLMDKIDLHS